MRARSTTTAGKIKVNLALEPPVYELLCTMAGNQRGLGGFVRDLILAEERRRQEEAAVLAHLRSGRRYASELQDALARLEESEARYDRLVSRMSAVVFEVTPDGELIFANQALTDLTGYAPAELAGTGWYRLLFPGEMLADLEEHFNCVGQGDLTAHEVVVATRDGRRAVMAVNTANHYHPDGTLERILGWAVEVTREIEKTKQAPPMRQRSTA